MDIKIRKLNSTDIGEFSDLIKIFEDVFEWDNFTFPNSNHLQRLLNNPNFFVFVATTGNQLVGGLTAHVIERYDTEKPAAYIYDLAVTTALQRKGIGRLLMATFNEYCSKNGFNEVFVQAETDDIQATNFYRTTPISSELKATHFTYSFSQE